MPKLTIDGKQVEVRDGIRLIEAVREVQDEQVPFYCYHPGLSIAGNCRMCVVEIEKMPKLQIACHTVVQEGMAVRTNTDRVKAARRHVLEFLLVNHPLDCPVCDQAGECWLQDYYMKYGLYDSRLNEDKIKKPKAVPLGPTVMLDAERCILCSRCVRFTDEISKTHELGMVNRGDRSEITVAPGRELNNPYSGNVVDICPVGALTDRDFRFKIRVWYLQSADTLCSGCSRGCSIQLQYNLDRPHHGKGSRVMRLKPRYNEAVNKWWMCDEGRYGYKFHDRNRILQPVKRGQGFVRTTGWDRILPEISEQIASAHGKIAVFLSPQLSNEELFLARKLFGERPDVFYTVLISPNLPGFQDDFLIRADKNPNSKGAGWLAFDYAGDAIAKFIADAGKGKVSGAVIFGQDLLGLYSRSGIEGALKKLDWSVFVGPNHNLTSEYAGYVLPAATYAEKEGTFTNFEGRVQRFNKALPPLGKALPETEIMGRLAARLAPDLKIPAGAGNIFKEMASAVKEFQGLKYEELGGCASDIRVQAAPFIPALEQGSNFL